MKSFKDYKLSTKLVGTFLLVGILSLVVLGFLSISLSGKALSRTGFNQLEAIREIKKNQIESFFIERIGDIKVLANNPFTIRAAKDMHQAFIGAGGVAGGLFIGKTNENYTAPDAYKKVHDTYFRIFKHYMEQYGYYDIFLMDPENGDTYFTVTKENDFGQRANEIDSSLRDVWRTAANRETITVSDTRPYQPSAGAPAQFIAAPIKENGDTVGILAFQLSLDAINRIMKERSGMGETGESYLIGPDKLMRSDSYLDPENHTVAASFANPAKGRVDTEAADEALNGKSGKKIIIDYNGNPVLSAYTPVKIGTTTWGLLAEIDKAEAFAAINSLKTKTFIIALIAALIICIIAIFISRSISSPIIKGVEMAGKMAKGDLTLQLDVRQKDEIGILADALNNMSANLNQMFTDISRGTRTLTSSSTELSAVSEQMSINSGHTVERSNNVSAAAEEMSVNMRSVANATEQTTTNIQMIVSAAEEMTATIREVSKSTAQGSETTSRAVINAREVSDRVEELSKAAAEINKVTETISDISEQTNLLALNATIEAARAGEAGKGFAVVAGEIKALAQQTAEATQEISAKIAGVQETTRGSVSAIDTILETVNEVDTIVTSVASAIEEQSATTGEITNNVTQAAAGVREVNDNVNETSTVAGDVTKDIAGVNQAAEEINNGCRQVNTSSTELSELAKNLNEMVGRFKI